MEQLDPVGIVILIMLALVALVLLIKAAVVIGAILTIGAILWCIMTATGTPMPTTASTSAPKPAVVCYTPGGIPTQCR